MKKLMLWCCFIIGSLLVIAVAKHELTTYIQAFGLAIASCSTAYIGYIEGNEEAKT